MDLIPDQGTEIPHTAQFSQKRKEKKEMNALRTIITEENQQLNQKITK